MENTPAKCKIRGWLLVLCLSLTLFSPLRSIYELTTTHIALRPFYHSVSGLSNLFIADIIVSALLIIFAVRAGLMLWLCKPFAVSTAKNYLIILFIMNLLSLSFPFMFLEQQLANEILPEIIKELFQPLIFVGVWYPYLTISKRVKQTYNLL